MCVFVCVCVLVHLWIPFCLVGPGHISKLPCKTREEPKREFPEGFYLFHRVTCMRVIPWPRSEWRCGNFKPDSVVLTREERV